MKRVLLAVSLLFAVSSMPLAAEKVEGYLVDKMCSAEVLKGGADAAKAHTKECALMDSCKDSGFGVVTADGKFIKFDADGDKMAVKMLGFEDSEDNIQAVVNGKVKGDTIAVIALQLR